ncbi:hypothetical protein GGF46_000514 [Coemansia sp. RSA 552]|nr:hypothetical protein GGF46_000514 [Coemansia sp. RSA 552]
MAWHGWRARRWHRAFALTLAALYTLDLGPVMGAETGIINPLGITFDYKLAWVNVEESTFGVNMQASAQPSYEDGAEWSLLMRYSLEAHANITAISKGWGLGTYDYATWALLPGKVPFEPLHFTVRSSGPMSLEDSVMKLSEPTLLILVPAARPSKSTPGYTLRKDADYTVNSGVNLAEVPKAAFGAWDSLIDTSAGLVVDVAEEPTSALSSASPTPTSAHSDAKADKGEDNDDDDSDGSSSPTPAESDAPEALETVLAPAKYIKGDPNYDPETDTLGTVLGAPKIGLYLVNTILGVGILAHVAGTIRRFQFKRQYDMSVIHSKSTGAAV